MWSASLRVGTSVGQNWGVEFEFVQSGEAEWELPLNVSPLALGQIGTIVPPGVALPIAAFTTEVGRKYPRAPAAVKQGVDREQKRVRC